MENVNAYYTVSALVFFVLLLVIGFLLSRRHRSESTHDFAVASRQLGAPRLVLMNIATYLSAVSLIGFTGYGYASGFAMISFFFGTILGHFPLALVSKKLHQWHVSSIPEFVGARYKSYSMRAWFGMVFVAIYTLYLMLNLVGVGVLLNSVAGLPVWLSELIILVALIGYVALGGMRVTSLINSVQAVVILVVVLLGAGIAVATAGGFGALLDDVRAVDPTLLSATSDGALTWSILLGTSMGWMAGVACRADFGAQALSGKRARVAGWTLGLPGLAIIVVYLALNLIGLSARTQLPKLANSDAAFPLFFSEIAPSWMGWIMIFALLSGITAACDSYILTISTIVSNDVIKPLMQRRGAAADRTERVSVYGARCTVLVAAAVAFVLSLADLPLLAVATLSLFVIWGSTCFVPLYGGLLWRRGSGRAALISSLVGVVLAVYWLNAPPFAPGAGAVIAIPVSLVVYVAISLASGRDADRPAPVPTPAVDV
ncbi:MAG: hypothetical protein GEV10_25480 [Streptosporangiales bacterium]|nr:hypothetical protein [Streptosporangiales bacterium]